MKVSTQTHKRSEAGFTLVELAIVMIIIGLLIGGILKGQELIKNAQVTNVISQIKGYDGAISTFDDKYDALPGDMLNAQNRLRNCTAAPCNAAAPANALGNRRISSGSDDPLDVPGRTNEGYVAFSQLAVSDLISGVTITGGNVGFGGELPSAKVGGGFWLGYSNDNALGGQITTAQRGHYLVFSGSFANLRGASTDGISATQAGQIDRKLDDGQPNTGTVFATGQDCIANGIYNESDVNSSCGLAIRVQG